MRSVTFLFFYLALSSGASASFGAEAVHGDHDPAGDGAIRRSSHLGDAGVLMLKLPQFLRTVSETPHLANFLPELGDWRVIQGGDGFIRSLPSECPICADPVRSPAAVHLCDAEQDHIFCAECLNRCPDNHHCPLGRGSMKRRQNRIIVEFGPSIGKTPQPREEYSAGAVTPATVSEQRMATRSQSYREVFSPGRTREVQTARGRMLVSDI